MESKILNLLKVKDGWENAGRMGIRLASDIFCGGRFWTPILWAGEEDPDLHKSEGLEKVE